MIEEVVSFDILFFCVFFDDGTCTGTCALVNVWLRQVVVFFRTYQQHKIPKRWGSIGFIGIIATTQLQGFVYCAICTQTPTFDEKIHTENQKGS